MFLSVWEELKSPWSQQTVSVKTRGKIQGLASDTG